jgi:hypothetical protein
MDTQAAHTDTAPEMIAEVKRVDWERQRDIDCELFIYRIKFIKLIFSYLRLCL